jgi:hypothetical protein
LLADPLREGRVTEALLAAVQQRREFPTRATQFVQVNAHKALQTIFRNPGPAKAPWQLKLVVNIPGVQHVTARLIGMGVRPEHIRGARKQPACEGQLLKKIAIGAGLLAGGVVLMARMARGFRRSYV